MQISKRDAEKYVNALNRHEGVLMLAAAEFGLSRDAYQRRLSYARNQHGLKPKNFELLAQAKKVTEAKEVADKRAADAAMVRSELEQARKDIERLNAEIERFKFATKADIYPAEWTLGKRVKHKGVHVPVLFVSDAQVGEVIDADEVEHGRGYSSPIFRERYRELIDTTIYLSDQHVGEDWQFPGIVYIRGGDAISGGIHEELRDTDDATPLEAVRIVFEEEAAGIEKLAEFFGKVEVKSVSGGNHDRSQLKPRGKKRVAHSYDALIDYMLAHHFRNDKRVTFQLTKSPDILFPIFGFKGLATHGDNIGAGGGTGFIGPLATILKGVSKIMLEQTKLGRIIDHVYVGHFHTFNQNRRFTSNGCFPGYSEFAKKFRMDPEPPIQSLQYWNAKRGVVDFKPIVLR